MRGSSRVHNWSRKGVRRAVGWRGRGCEGVDWHVGGSERGGPASAGAEARGEGWWRDVGAGGGGESVGGGEVGRGDLSGRRWGRGEARWRCGSGVRGLGVR